LFHAVDWLPTLTDVGIFQSSGKPLDGVSQFNALRENKEARSETFVGYSGREQKENVADLFAVIRYDKWILVREPYENKFLLFDLKIWTSQKTRNSLHAFQALSQTSKRKWKTTRMTSTFLLHQKTLMCIVLHTPLHPQVGGRKHGFRGVENEQQSNSLTDTVYFTF
jgi:arylsulfatase A-like enzyme